MFFLMMIVNMKLVERADISVSEIERKTQLVEGKYKNLDELNI
jgi:hypothetical protein